MNEPLEDQGIEKPSKKSNIIIFILLFLIIISAAFFAYAKSQNIDLKSLDLKNLDLKKLISSKLTIASRQNDIKKYSEIKFDSKENPVFCVYKELIIKCTKSKIQGIDKNGYEQWSIPISMNEPILKTSENDLLVADVGGRDIYVINGKDIKWSTKLDSNIINADISSIGYVTVIKEDKRTRGSIVVYNLQGNEFFTKGIGESFVLSAKVSPSGKQVFISSVDTEGVNAVTFLQITDILGKTTAANRISDEGNIFTSMFFLNNDTMITCSDDFLLCFDKMGKEIFDTKKLFQNIKVLSSDVSLEKYPVLAFTSPNSNYSEIVLLNSKGEKVSQYKLEGQVINMETYSDIIAVNTGREVYFINTSRKLIGKYSSKTEIVGVYFFNKQEAEIVTKESIAIANVNGQP